LQAARAPVDYRAADEVFVKRQEAIAQCMKERGFIYHPLTPASVLKEETVNAEDNDLSIPWLPDSLEEVRRVGYGISPPEDLGEFEEAITSEADASNTEYRDGLSPDAQREYDLALGGYHGFEGAANPDTEACWPSAAARFPETEQWVVEPSLLAGWPEAIDNMVAALATEAAFDGSETTYGAYAIVRDPRLKELNSRYSECVKSAAGGGWNASWVDDVEDPIHAAIQTAPDGSEFDWQEGVAAMDATDIPIEYRSLVGSQVEIDIAVVDFECRQETDYVHQYAQILADAETRYIEDHKAELEAMMAAIDRIISGI
ncbi:MAG: hypothetical protein LBC97_16455, partial [Bifidobacteriaceae bacterium]|nr:hypothetical protein [Bifidobacteriaceae bacterium]